MSSSSNTADSNKQVIISLLQRLEEKAYHHQSGELERGDI